MTVRSYALNFSRPKLFSSPYTDRIVDGDGALIGVTAASVDDSGIMSTSSFRYDVPGSGLRSTQQLPVDWSKFENHTFYSSAEVNVNVAMSNIINYFPFDGTKSDYENFTDSLTGFEKWTLDSFPTNMGYLIFSASSIVVSPFAGSAHRTLSRNDSGECVLDPGEKSFTVEMQLYLSGTSNNNQSIFQYVSPSSGSYYGFTVGLNSTSSATTGSVFLAVTSGTSYSSCSFAVEKGRFNHLAFTFDRDAGAGYCAISLAGTVVVTSSNRVEIGQFNYTTESVVIGSGTSHSYPNSWTPAESFLGFIDELRFFHAVRTPEQLKRYSRSNVFASDDLKLYYKFNEPSGSIGSQSSIILDSSGNSLHSAVTNYSSALRTTGSLTSRPLSNESAAVNPVLFPNYSPLSTLNTELLASASLHDSENPNLITRLVPKHYLVNGMMSDALGVEEGDIGDALAGNDMPGSAELGSTQLLSALLYTWAKQLDEMKMYSDHFSEINFVSYDGTEGSADTFLPRLFKHYGLDVPAFFGNASTDQFVNSENIGANYGISQASLGTVQNAMWRRILVNIKDIIDSKGTLHSIRSIIRAVGINPDTTLRIREYGGPTSRNLENARQVRTEVSTLLDFSGSLASVSPTLSAQGVPSNKPFIFSGYLSSSRYETGFPSPVGTFVNKPTYPVHGISNNTSDGLHTSGSWTIEAIYKFVPLLTGSHPLTQSLVRLNTTGSLATHNVLCNVVACSGTDDSVIKLFSSYVSSSTSPLLEMVVTGVNIYDGNQWSISFGRRRSDEIGAPGTSSWFLRAGRSLMGDLVESHTSATYLAENADSSNAFQVRSAVFNASGSFITIGSQSLNSATFGSAFFLNDSAVTGTQPRMTNFTGRVGHVRFWSKALTEDEWLSHVINFKSLGVTDPLKNFNFMTQPTGSFERLRLDITTDQITTSSNSQGAIELFDFSQSGIHASGSGFEVSKVVIVPETFRYSHISPHFDEASSDNKVRVRGFLKQENVDLYSTSVSPTYAIPPSERPNDDTRFSIDFSVVDALNEDIMRMFSTLDSIDNAIGDPTLMSSDDYPDLQRMREIYFRRLTDIVNLKSFFEFFRWFDSSMGTIIEQLLPRKTKFMGTNFVIESHALERGKIRYSGEEVRVPENSRLLSNATIVEDNHDSSAA